MKLKVEADLTKLSEGITQFRDKLQKDVVNAISDLAAATHGKVLDLASQLSPNEKEVYREALEFKRLEENLWVVSLDKSALYIEDGVDSYSMYDTHLKSPKAKMSKEGFKYMNIPFKHNKKESKQTDKEKALTQLVKDELKERQIPFKGIERNLDGSPRVGKIHSFDINSARPSAKAKDMALKGVSIYQTLMPNGKVRRDIMTFRTISEKFKGDGRWQHPGKNPAHLMESAWEWADRKWNEEILPEIMKKYR